MSSLFFGYEASRDSKSACLDLVERAIERLDAGRSVFCGARRRPAAVVTKKSPRIRLTDALKTDIVRRWARGEDAWQIAAAIGCCRATVGKVLAERRGKVAGRV